MRHPAQRTLRRDNMPYLKASLSDTVLHAARKGKNAVFAPRPRVRNANSLYSGWHHSGAQLLISRS
jgi:hypothetical protein